MPASQAPLALLPHPARHGLEGSELVCMQARDPPPSQQPQQRREQPEAAPAWAPPSRGPADGPAPSGISQSGSAPQSAHSSRLCWLPSARARVCVCVCGGGGCVLCVWGGEGCVCVCACMEQGKAPCL